GYILPKEPMVTGELTQLVAYAGQELSILFNGLQQQFSAIAWFTSRLTEPLLADLMLINLLKLQQHKPIIDIYQQAQRWFSALDMPAQYLDSLYKQPNDKQWSVKRVSCCMYYRRSDGDFCLACPNK
ncbi:MAG: (2Fe-2S)-binding protein, partial [Moritella sp.]|uniref:(2Fe-2S)-binding protein n=1 Tax=Moritella sp. TaxID=78556 RepID=UPI00216FA6E8